jgi:aminoglycoside phosphotransferase (APT) family kinase protein
VKRSSTISRASTAWTNAAIGLSDLGKPQVYLERQVKGWIERYHNSKTHDLPEVGLISAWLTERMPVSHGAALIHNDYKYDNVVHFCDCYMQYYCD